MESNRKRKGFMKGKLGMKSLYRSATTSKPPSSSTPQFYDTNKVVKPSPLIPPASSMGYNNIVNKLQDHHHHHLHHPMNKERIQPSSTASVNVHQQLDQQYANQRLVVAPASPLSSNASVELLVNQEKVTPHPPEQKVPILLQESSSSLDSCANVVGGLYSVLAADEGVDVKAATYISSVRERFRLQQLAS